MEEIHSINKAVCCGHQDFSARFWVECRTEAQLWILNTRKYDSKRENLTGHHNKLDLAANNRSQVTNVSEPSS